MVIYDDLLLDDEVYQLPSSMCGLGLYYKYNIFLKYYFFSSFVYRLNFMMYTVTTVSTVCRDIYLLTMADEFSSSRVSEIRRFGGKDSAILWSLVDMT